MASSFFSSTSELNSHRDVLAYNQKRYAQGVEDGWIVPTVYPAFSYGAGLLILFLLIPPTSRFHNRLTRYLTFAASAAWHIYMIRHCKGWGPSVSFGIGILSAYGVLYAAVLLVFNDAKADWKRVKREEAWFSKEIRQRNQYEAVKPTANGDSLRQRKAQTSSEPSQDPRIQLSLEGPQRIIEERRITYRWQPYPLDSFYERCEWVGDVLTTMRGVGWEWTISGLPSRPGLVQLALRADAADQQQVEDKPTSRNGISRFDTYWSLMLHNAWLFTKGYVGIDILKTIMVHDPYFWGLVDRSPPNWLPHFIQVSWFWTRSYRLLICMSFIWLGLRTIYCWGPMFFVGLLGRAYIGANGEPWMYPDHYGSYSNVFTRGLAGWWGGWWHQVFRFGFQAGATWLTNDVLRLQARSMLSNVISLFVAFALSGFLHGSGSITMHGDTLPLRNSFTFFILQPIGIMLEVAWRQMLKKTGLASKIPWWVGWTISFVYVHLWFVMTGPLLTDDFSRGGLWLFEPVMFSPLRGLGFGVEGDSFFCWGGKHFAWHSDSRWWMSGIAL